MTTDLKLSVNSLEYLNEVYSGDWKKGYQEAYTRLDKDIFFLDRFQKHLDVGCADGYFTTTYLKLFPDTTGWGIDLSDVVINQTDGVHFITGDVYKLPFAEEFDLVHSAELLEHLEKPKEALAEMARVLKPGGTLVLTTPFKENPLYEEHLWSWGVEDICNLTSLKLVEADEKFFNHIMRLVFKK